MVCVTNFMCPLKNSPYNIKSQALSINDADDNRSGLTLNLLTGHSNTSS